MPRPKRPTGSPSYSPGQAHYVLNRLIDERRLSHGEVSRYVTDMHGEISSLEQRLASLRAAAGHSASSGASSSPTGRRRGRPPGSGRKAGAAASSAGASSSGSSAAAPAQRGPRGRRPGRPSGAAGASGGGAASGRKKSALSPEQLASRQLQGRYLGLIRQIPASRRGQYQKIAKEKGREAAIREMQDNLKK
jgi:hypothetical protein